MQQVGRESEKGGGCSIVFVYKFRGGHLRIAGGYSAGGMKKTYWSGINARGFLFFSFFFFLLPWDCGG